MKKLYYFTVIIFIFLILSGCASLYVTSTIGPGVQPHVRKQMVETERRMAKERREIDRLHNQQRREIEKAQNQPWNL